MLGLPCAPEHITDSVPMLHCEEVASSQNHQQYHKATVFLTESLSGQLTSGT
jgi:hypothetical protein